MNPLVKHSAIQQHTRLSMLLDNIRKHRWHYIFLVPMLTLFVSFTLWPVVMSGYYSFFKWDGAGSPQDYIGFQNFRDIAADPFYWKAFLNNYVFSLAQVGIEMPAALLFAILLNQAALKGRNLYRLFIFLPVVTTTAVVGLIFDVMLHPSGGAASEFMIALGLTPINFLGSENTALSTVIAVSIWKHIGVTLIYWLAALQTIPHELYEAGRIDGASAPRLFVSITLPLLLPFAAIILLLTFVKTLHPFDLVQTMTKGGPNFSTDVVDTFVYRYAFDPHLGNAKYGYASAAGFLFGLSIMFITFIQLWVTRRKTNHIFKG